MDTALKTNRELAQFLLCKLADAEIERQAMTAVLDSCRDIETRQLLAWKPMVQRIRTEITQGSPLARYSDIKTAIDASTPECPQALLLLTEVAARQDQTK